MLTLSFLSLMMVTAVGPKVGCEVLSVVRNHSCIYSFMQQTFSQSYYACGSLLAVMGVTEAMQVGSLSMFSTSILGSQGAFREHLVQSSFLRCLNHP